MGEDRTGSARNHVKDTTMKTYRKVILTTLVGIGFGAAGVQILYAQAKPPVYYISEIEVTNPEGYGKEYVPKVLPVIEAAGGRHLAAGAKTTAIEGEPPKSRVIVVVFDSIEKVQALHNSAAYKDARAIGDKYAKFRTFTVEGLPPK